MIDGVLIKSDENLLNKLGKTDTIEGYEIEQSITPELVNSVPNLSTEIGDFKSIAHDIGLTNEQAQKLVEMRMHTLQSQEEQNAQLRVNSEAKLKEIWGNEYNNRLDAAKQVAKIYSDKYSDEMTQLINSPAGNNPAFLNILSELAVIYKEKGHEGLSTSQFGMTPEDAIKKIAEKRDNEDFKAAHNDFMHPRHESAVNELMELYKIKNQ